MCTPVPLGMKYGPSCIAEDIWVIAPLDMQFMDKWRPVFGVYPRQDLQHFVWHSDQLDERLTQWMSINIYRDRHTHS